MDLRSRVMRSEIQKVEPWKDVQGTDDKFKATKKSIHQHAWGWMVLLAKPVMKGAPNVGALALGMPEGNVDGLLEGEGEQVSKQGAWSVQSWRTRARATMNHFLWSSLMVVWHPQRRMWSLSKM